ncbi:MAG: hypothetical protein QXJ66_06240 [Candidatus Methanomethylicia archaeon]
MHLSKIIIAIPTMIWLSLIILNIDRNIKSFIKKLILSLSAISFLTIIYLNLDSMWMLPKIELFIPQFPSSIGLAFIGLFIILTIGYVFSLILLPESSIIQRIITMLGLGLGINAALFIILGIFMIFTTFNAIIIQFTFLLIAFIILSRRSYVLHIDFRMKVGNIKIPKYNFATIIMITITIGFIFFILYPLIVTPVIEWDSLVYGINYAKVIFENSGIPLIAGPSIGKEMSFNYPPGHQVLVAYLFNLTNDPDEFYYRFLASIVVIGVILATYELSKALLCNQYQSLLAVITLCGIIILYWDQTENYNIYITFFSTSSMLFIIKALSLEFEDEKMKNFNIIITLFCSFAGLISYIGVPLIGMMIIMHLIIFRRISFKRLIYHLLLSLIIMSPFYMRNLLLLGNPFYPMLGIGKYLDQTLYKSAIQHFKNYFILTNINIDYLIKSCLWVPALFYLITFTTNDLSKLKLRDSEYYWLRILLYSYPLLIPLAAFLFHAPFPRYFLMAYPIFTVLLSKILPLNSIKQSLMEKIISTIILLAIIGFSVLTITSSKSVVIFEDKVDYIVTHYEDAVIWKWINVNTQENDVIATYEIREYYINRKIMLLDGYTAIPLYKMADINEALEYLHQHGVKYVLSVPWASPQDIRMPPAYDWLIITKYFGNHSLLPPVYIAPNGATIYSIKSMSEEELFKTFSKYNLVPPLKKLKLNITILNITQPPSGRIYLPIPCDYARGQIHVWVNSSNKLVSIELWEGIINLNVINWWEKYNVKSRSPPLSIGLGAKNPELIWNIDKGGYLTLMIVAWEPIAHPFNVTVNIEFYNKWEIRQNNSRGEINA